LEVALAACPEEVSPQLTVDVGRFFVGIGLTLLVMSLLVRLAKLSAADQVGDDLAVITSTLVVVLGAVVLRRSSR
jgi:hypothetical protein